MGIKELDSPQSVDIDHIVLIGYRRWEAHVHAFVEHLESYSKVIERGLPNHSFHFFRSLLTTAVQRIVGMASLTTGYALWFQCSGSCTPRPDV